PWLVGRRARQDRAAAPEHFRCAAPKVESAEMTYQRYQDADLATAEQEVTLEHQYQGGGKAWLWIVASASAVLVVLLLLNLILVVRRRPRAVARMKLPEKLTPFTVTVLLRR